MVARTNPDTRSRCGVVKTSSVGILALQTMPFLASDAPPASTCVLLSGSALAPQNASHPCFGSGSGVQAPDRDGLRCAVQSVQRHGNRVADASGAVTELAGPSRVWGGPTPLVGGLAGHGGFVAGQTRMFQVAHRDLPAAVCMRGLNSSQAVEVTFVP